MQAFKIFSLLLLSLIPLASIAQKVKIKKERYIVKRTLLPHSPLEEDIYFFEVQLDNALSIKEAKSDQSLINDIKITGLKRVNNQDKHITIKVFTKNFKINSLEMKTRKEVTKDKEGKVTGTKYFYKYKTKYTIGGGYESLKPDGSILTPNKFVLSEVHSGHYNTKEFSSSTALKNYWNANISAIKSDLIRHEISSLTTRISTELTDLIGYRIQSASDYLWILDSKKHPENTAFQGHVNSILDEFYKMTPTTKPDNMEEELKNTIKYFQDISSLPIKDKHSKRLVFASIYNLSNLYYYIDEPLKSKEWANKLIKLDIDKKEGEASVTRAQNLFDLFDKNEKFSTHFERTIPEVSEENNAIELEVKTVTQTKKQSEDIKFIQGTVITNDDKEIDGYFLNDFISKPWEIQDGVKFVSKNNFDDGRYSKKSVEKYSPKELKGLGFQDKTFLPILYSDVSKISDNPLASTAKLRFLELKIDGKYKLVDFHEEPSSFQSFSGAMPEESDSNEMDVYQLILEPNEKKATRATTKNVEKILEDYPKIKARYQEGEFNKDGEPIKTNRSIGERLDAKLGLDDNLKLSELIDTLNK